MVSPYREDEVPEKKNFSLSTVEVQVTESEANDVTSQGHSLPSDIVYNFLLA